MNELDILVGKTIEKIEYPSTLEINDYSRCDDNVVITFTDGTVCKLASWDYEGYSSGISKEIITRT